MCYGESSWCHLWADKSIELSPTIKSLRVVLLGPHLPSTGEGDTSANGNLCSAFRQMGVRVESFFFLSTVSQLSSAQNNPSAKVAYFRSPTV